MAVNEKNDECSPQVEDGYTRIANELLDALIDIRMPGEVRRVYDYILRMTYGYNRKEFETTHRRIAERLRANRQRVTEALSWLCERNMVISTKNRADLSPDCLTVLRIQKRYKSWGPARKTVLDVSARKTVPNQHGKVCRISTENRASTIKDNLKDNSKDSGRTNEPGTENRAETIPNNTAKPSSPNSDVFSRFWEAYPRKVGKLAALKAWKKLKTPATILPKILEAIEQQRASPQWTKDGGQYIPNPATWLNQGRWEDEPQQGPVVDWSEEKKKLDDILSKAQEREKYLRGEL